MQEQDISVYDKIFDIVAENLRLAGKPFEYGKHTFLCDVASHPQDICVSRYLHLSNLDFMQAVYVAALKRLPDKRTAAFWNERSDMPKGLFQEQVLRCIANSSVVAINHIHLLDNPYFKQKRGLKYRMLGMLYGLTNKSSLRKLGKRMPDPLQKLIRKVFL